MKKLRIIGLVLIHAVRPRPVHRRLRRAPVLPAWSILRHRSDRVTAQQNPQEHDDAAERVRGGADH
jgi:hypothetical protein